MARTLSPVSHRAPLSVRLHCSREAAGPAQWRVDLYCPNCDHASSGVFSQQSVDRFDERLDDATTAIVSDLKRLEAAGMAGAPADHLADATRQSAGSSISALRAEGASGPLGDTTQAAVDALAVGFADASRWSMLGAAAFLALGFLGAVRLRRAGGKARHGIGVCCEWSLGDSNP